MAWESPRWLVLWTSLAITLTLLIVVVPPPVIGLAANDAGDQSAVVTTIPIDRATVVLPPTYDGANGNLYASGYWTPQVNGTVSVISGATNTVIAIVTVGWAPGSATVDPYDSDVYVANYDPGCGNCGSGFWQAAPNVTVISGTTNAAVSSIRTLANPIGVTFDPVNGDLYVPDNTFNAAGNGSVSVISGATNEILETISVGAFPTNVFYDSASGDLYVTDQVSDVGVEAPDQISVISGSTNTVIGSIPMPGIGTGPVILDSSNGDVYVGGANGVSVISSATNTLIQDIPISNARLGFLDPQGDVYVICPGSPATVSVISGISNTVVATFSVGTAGYMTYDPANGDIYTTTFGSDILNVTSIATHKQIQSLNLGPWESLFSTPVYDPGNGDLYLAQMGPTTNIVVIAGNGTLPSESSPSLFNSWFFLGVGVVIGVLTTWGVVVLFRMRNTPREAKTDSSPPSGSSSGRLD